MPPHAPLRPSRFSDRDDLLAAPLLRVLIAFQVLTATYVGQAPAQVPIHSPRDSLPTFALVGVPLPVALEALIDRTQINIVYQSDLVVGRTSFCTIRRGEEEQVLKCILAGTGLDYIRTSAGSYVLVEHRRTEPLYGWLSGSVVDASTGEPLAHANVLIAQLRTGVMTNAAGRFAFSTLKPGPYVIAVTHVAYHRQVDTVWVQPSSGSRVAVNMRQRTVSTGPIVIDGIAARFPPDGLGLGRAPEGKIMGSMATTDVLADLGSVVGVRAGDATADVHVQGGAAGEHGFVLDGATVFVPIQNGGFIGSFSPFAIRQVNVQKAGFGAEHGSHLSGVVEADQHVNPSPAEAFLFRIDPLSINGRVGLRKSVGPEVEIAGMVAGRSSLWDLYRPAPAEDLLQSWATPDLVLADALGLVSEPPIDPSRADPVDVGFSDVHGALRVRVSDLHSIRGSFYRGHNKLGDDMPTGASAVDPSVTDTRDEYSWTNMTGSVGYEGVLGSRSFANLSLWSSSYEFLHPFNRAPFPSGDPHNPSESLSEDFNGIDEFGVSGGWQYASGAHHFVSTGIEAVRTGSDFSLTLDPTGESRPATADQMRPESWRIGTYVENSIAVSHKTTLTAGSRLTYLPRSGRVYLEPRFSVRFDFLTPGRATVALRGAVGLYRQFVNQFDVTTYSVTAIVPRVRFWAPVSAEDPVPSAYHAVASLLYQSTGPWRLVIDSFFKHYPRLLVLDYSRLGSDSTFASDGTGLLTPAKGYAYGAAVSGGRRTDGFEVDARYEYTFVRRQIPGRFSDRYAAVPWTAPHVVVLSAAAEVVTDLTASIRWQGVFGRVWGYRQSYYDYLEPLGSAPFQDPDLSKPSDHRLPTFSQVDVSLAYSRRVLGATVLTRASVLNVLDRRNVRDWNLVRDPSSGSYAKSTRALMPVFPFVSIQVTW